MTPKEAITAALRKLGPASPTVIANATGDAVSKVSYHLRSMLAGKELKASGKTMGRLYALPEQNFPEAGDTPPQGGKRKKKGKRPGSKKTRKPRRARTPRATAKRSSFTPAITCDHALVLIEDGVVRTFTPEQTSAIADLMLAHFDADS